VEGPIKESETYHQVKDLSLITYNVLLDTMDGKNRLFPYIFQSAIRYRKILDELKERQPLFISLNEVTNTMLEMVENEDWIQQNYHMSVNKPIGRIGNVLLSKLKPKSTHLISVHKLDSEPILTNTYNMDVNGNKFTMTVSSLHLTSIDKNYKIREQQFNELHDELLIINKDGPHILMGDMNFHSEDENKVFLSKGYVDCWLRINDHKEGYTFDAKKNKLIQIMFFGMEHRRMRLDRVLIYDVNNKLNIKNMEIIGTEPIFPEREYKGKSKLYGWYLLLRGLNPRNSEEIYGRYLYNSDHYGLTAELEIGN
jgi:endonuclease/exonuclease/phosphatase family metal-dependent hydrolase